MSQGKVVKEEIVKIKPIADSIADDLIMQGIYVKEDMSKFKGVSTFIFWEEHEEVKVKKEFTLPSDDDDDLDELRAEYEKVVGKKAHPMAKEATLREHMKKASK